MKACEPIVTFVEGWGGEGVGWEPFGRPGDLIFWEFLQTGGTICHRQTARQSEGTNSIFLVGQIVFASLRK
jgi:hypothetical protein